MICSCISLSRDIDGVLSCYNKIVKKINADQPKADVFSQGTCIFHDII